MSATNRQILLARRPVGFVDATTTTLVEVARPACGTDEALIRVGTLSIDLTIRTWMDDAPGYLAPIGIGEVVRSSGTGVVVETNSPSYQVGDVVFGMTGGRSGCSRRPRTASPWSPPGWDSTSPP